jgi:hypothetical protein
VNSLKDRATLWLLQNKKQLLSGLESSFHFKIDGFADEPIVYISVLEDGLEFGYVGEEWRGHTPIPVNIKKYFLPLNFPALNKEAIVTEQVLDFLLKTVQSRKRQYRTCQFCNLKVAPEHRFDKNTCHGCSTEQYGIDY